MFSADALKPITLTDALASSLLPYRNGSADKTAFGNALLVAGSDRYCGAPFFAASACQRCGVGLARLLVPKRIHSIIAGKLNETMVIASERSGVFFEAEAADEALALAARSSAVLTGPGLGVADGTKELVKRMVLECDKPLVLDADALNCLAGHPDVFVSAAGQIIITPHEREFSRLFSIDACPTDSDLVSFASRYGIVIVLKSARTRIAAPNGNMFVNSDGMNSGMAKGGSGDMLAGMVLSFLAQGMERADAACLAVRLHSIAGRIARDKFTEFSMLPEDCLACLPKAFKKLMEMRRGAGESAPDPRN